MFAALLTLILVAIEPQLSHLTLVPAGEPGQPLVIEGQVVDAKGDPISGARLHVYQTDTTGRYTPDRPMDEPHARLSGWLTTDARGHFELTTIRPGEYTKTVRLGDRDRKIPAHIHIDADASGYVSRRTQVVFAGDPLLSDPYWRDWVARLHQPVVTVAKAGTTERAMLILELERTKR